MRGQFICDVLQQAASRRFFGQVAIGGDTSVHLFMPPVAAGAVSVASPTENCAAYPPKEQFVVAV